jgi:hypothetical protein
MVIVFPLKKSDCEKSCPQNGKWAKPTIKCLDQKFRSHGGLFFDSARRQGFRAHELFEQLDRFGIAWNLFDRLFMIFGQKRRRLVGRKFFILAEELGISIGFPKSLLENLYPIFGCSGRKNKGVPLTRKRAATE